LECPNALAKQVLSQLSYTPTVGLTVILRHLQSRENSKCAFSPFVFNKMLWVLGFFQVDVVIVFNAARPRVEDVE
jgi:hypothetical protein